MMDKNVSLREEVENNERYDCNSKEPWREKDKANSIFSTQFSSFSQMEGKNLRDQPLYVHTQPPRPT